MTTECSLCFYEYNNEQRLPKLLPCGHEYCASCIAELEKQQCPFCTADFIIEDGPEMGLPTVYSLLPGKHITTNSLLPVPRAVSVASGRASSVVSVLQGTHNPRSSRKSQSQQNASLAAKNNSKKIEDTRQRLQRLHKFLRAPDQERTNDLAMRPQWIQAYYAFCDRQSNQVPPALQGPSCAGIAAERLLFWEPGALSALSTCVGPHLPDVLILGELRPRHGRLLCESSSRMPRYVKTRLMRLPSLVKLQAVSEAPPSADPRVLHMYLRLDADLKQAVSEGLLQCGVAPCGQLHYTNPHEGETELLASNVSVRQWQRRAGTEDDSCVLYCTPHLPRPKSKACYIL